MDTTAFGTIAPPSGGPNQDRPPTAIIGGKPFLSAQEVAALLGVTPGRVFQLARAGLLPSVRLGRRVLIPRRGLDALADDAIARARATQATQ